MNKRKFKNLLSVLLIIFVCLSIANFDVKLNALENVYANEYAYYKVNETLSQSELYDGVEYRHDSAFTAVTDETKIIGYECGGKTYSDVPFYLNKEYTQSAHVLTIPKTSNVKVAVWAVINSGKWTLSNIIATAKDYEAKNPGYKVIAGINADFFDISGEENYPYAACGAWISGGEVYKTERLGGWRAVEFHNDGSNVPYTHHSNPIATDKPTLYVYDQNGDVVYTKQINNINTLPLPGETSLYFGEYDSNHRCNSINVEGAYVVEEAEMSIAYSRTSFYGLGEISSIGNATLGVNQFAIKTNDTYLNEALKLGVKVKVQYKFTGDMADAQEVTGYVTTFLKDGQHYEEDENYSYMEYRFPRTLVGYREDGTLVMAATDGRQASKGFYGLNGVESSAQMAYYGCTTAFSLDGGGSTTMAILKDGELTVVNSPSDGNIRSDGNAILLVAPVPDVEMLCNSTENSITVKLDIIKMIDEYKELYIEVNGEKKKYEGKDLVFENLKSNTKYPVIMYGTKGSEYVMIPIQNAVMTKKQLFEINSIQMKVVEINGIEYYEITWSITDLDETISNISLKVGRDKVYSSDNKILIKKDSGSPTTCKGELVIAYALASDSGKGNYVVDVSLIEYSSTETLASSVMDKINKMFEDILN